jgi:predicted metalloendopeptidase
VQEVTPSVSIATWFAFFKPLGLGAAKISHLLVTVPSFFSNVTALVHSYASSAPGVLQAYQIWNAINARAMLLTDPVRAEHFRCVASFRES